MQAISETTETSGIIDAEFVDKTLQSICQTCRDQNKPLFCDGNDSTQCAILALTDLLTAKPQVKKAIKSRKANTPKKPKKPLLTREQKAQKLFDEGVRPEVVDRDCWSVKGSKDNDYEIRNDHDMWSCSCPDFFSRGLMCKHILLARMCAETRGTEIIETATNVVNTCGTCLNTHRLGGHSSFVLCEERSRLYEPNKPACELWVDRHDIHLSRNKIVVF